MRVNNTGLDSVARTGLATGASGASNTEAVAPAAAPERRKDSVSFSAEGREMARVYSGGPASGDLSAERVAQIRDRISSGFYDSPAVVQEVARRMLERGDI